MPYANLDDKLWNHPKMDYLHGAAFELYICSISFCADRLTDGHLTDSEARRLAGFRGIDWSVVDLLVACPSPDEGPFWEIEPGGFIVHNYLPRNRSKAKILSDQADNARRQEDWRKRHEEEERIKKEERNALRNGSRDGPHNGVTNGVANTVPYPDPYPVPVRSPENSVSSHEETAALTRSPAGTYQDFQDRMRAEKNKPAVLAEAISAWYGIDCREFARLAKLGGQFGFGELLKTAFNVIPGWNGTDNPVNFIQATATGRKNGRNGPIVERLPANHQPADVPLAIDDGKSLAESNEELMAQPETPALNEYREWRERGRAVRPASSAILALGSAPPEFGE